MEPEKKGEIVEAKEQKPEEKAKPEETKIEEIKVSNANKSIVAIAIFALLLGSAGLALGWIAYEKSNTPITFLGGGSDGNSANFVEGSIADIADKVSKSVVSITTSTKATDFFGQSYDSSAAGTGIIVTEDGYVLTNKHVINGASKVTVILDDGTTYEDVKVVATDPLNDIAFLKINDVDNLPAAKLGDSKTISVGQQVIAIGNALGQYQNTVTSGIISGTGRSITASDGSGYNAESLSDMIQTDAAINSGNSGGPLVNAAGEVIGINTATSSSAENMGFAIPISSVKGMLSQLTETGKAERAYLGVYSVEITPEAAKAYNLPVNSGAYLYSSSSYSAIIKNSPAAKGGLKDKDIVTKINGVEVGNTGSLSSLIGEYKPGDTVQLTVIREGKETAINVTLEGYPDK
ncbi:trypsin-like peptidase domain-containing protein [Candidatus Saccharibacteria bacterium]|nr:trypsin-like peptidase domain-containing protein [Candidatus Saccharibacteria bacterium]MBQ3436489.1 trypsin-like peptidase domain-containing protein [Candidatus Saccharibacteria bacterium]